MTPEKKVEPAPLVPPFVRFVASAIPMVFDDSLSYYECLAALTKYLQDVVDVINNNGAVTEEYIQLTNDLQSAFTELKTYVDTYFDNLDVQTEINNKLDEMVEDGSLTAIITPIVGDQIDQLSQTVTDTLNNYSEEIDDISEEVGSQRLIKYRKENYNNYTLIEKPADFTDDFFKNFNIYGNGKGNYFVNYDKEEFINQNSTNNWYFAPDGNDSNSGEDAEHPKLHINASFVTNSLQNGDTIHLKSGLYTRDCPLSSQAITKGVNLVCDDGEAIFTLNDSTLVWSQYGNNSWTTTRGGIDSIYDISKFISEGKVSKLQLVGSAELVDSTPNSYYLNGSTLYVHLFDNQQPTINNMAITLAIGYPAIQLLPTANNTKYYLKNVTVLGGDTGSIVCNASGYTGCSVLLEDCKIYNTFARTYAYDAFSNIGFNSICDNVIILNSEKDGFNYHNSSSIPAFGLEINCSCNNCGETQFNESRLSNNATTAHDNCKVISVNGNYTLCNGGEVVDVNNAIRACYNCLIADSYRGREYDAYVTDSAKMYLYDCYFKGSTASKNLMTGTEPSVIYIKDCEYDTKTGNVVDLN